MKILFALMLCVSVSSAQRDSIIYDGIMTPTADGWLVLKWSPEVTTAQTLKAGSMGEIWIY